MWKRKEKQKKNCVWNSGRNASILIYFLLPPARPLTRGQPSSEISMIKAASGVEPFPAEAAVQEWSPERSCLARPPASNGVLVYRHVKEARPQLLLCRGDVSAPGICIPGDVDASSSVTGAILRPSSPVLLILSSPKDNRWGGQSCREV